MQQAVSTQFNAASPRSAVVLDSPHSGTDYPADFGYDCELQALRCAEDTFVDELYDFAPALGVPLVLAHFPRSYLDANRHPAEIDPLLLDAPWPGELISSPKVALGKGLLWRMLDDGTPIYQRKLGVAQVQARIGACWQPYHQALQTQLDATHCTHGRVLHINCHSMPAVAAQFATGFAGVAHPDFVVGDRDGSSAHPAISAWLVEYLRALGYSVALNHPYKGVELVRRYSAPLAGRHSIQLEINRKLYMSEQTLQKHRGFAPLRAQLQQLLAALIELDTDALILSAAAPTRSAVLAVIVAKACEQSLT